MTSHSRYSNPVPHETWDVPMAGSARFSWEYDEGRQQLLDLYAKGKAKQWDAATRIDWDVEVDPYNPLGAALELNPIYGSDMYEALSEKERQVLGQHLASWNFSQFLHGEQGAAICASRIVESVPDIDAKFYAATQVIDEARHVEAYSRFLHEKVELIYPINVHLQELLRSTLSDSRWDMPYLGMQVIIEGVALAAFGTLRETATNPVAKQILSYVMQDEARHVAFGRLALRDFYKNLTTAEREEREEFVVEGCYLLRDRLRAREVWETLDMPVERCLTYVEDSVMMRHYRSLLFMRIVPIVKDIGLWGEKIQKAYADMGVLDYAGIDVTQLMADDEARAEALDEERELARRAAQVDEVIAVGAES